MQEILLGTLASCGLRLTDDVDVMPDDKHSMARKLANGDALTLTRMLFNWRVSIGPADVWYFNDAWCFPSIEAAVAAFNEWDGEGEPKGWSKHPNTGRWRPDGDPAREERQ